jgi:hypothetical protein
MAEVMKRGGRGHLGQRTVQQNAVATRCVTCHTVTRNVTGVTTVHVFDVKSDYRLGLLSRCLFPELMGEKMMI